MFHYIDGQGFRSDEGPGRFWARALESVGAHARGAMDKDLARSISAAEKSGYRVGELTDLFVRMERSRLRLVLLIDEFDALIKHPMLGHANLFGGLRSLAQRPDLGLCVVGASRLSVTTLNHVTSEMGGGSPFFNFAEEVVLGPLTPPEIQRLLGPGRFVASDLYFLSRAAGGHPFLLQAGAAALWEAHDSGEKDPERRRTQAASGLRKAAARALGDTWSAWPEPHRVVFLTVAAIQLQRAGSKREGSAFDVEGAARELGQYAPELEDLVERGFLTADPSEPDGWRIWPEALLWWLADELVRAVRDPTSLEAWLERHQVAGGLTRDQRAALTRTVGGLLGMLRDGARGLIEAAARAAGEGAVKGYLA